MRLRKHFTLRSWSRRRLGRAGELGGRNHLRPNNRRCVFMTQFKLKFNFTAWPAPGPWAEPGPGLKPGGTLEVRPGRKPVRTARAGGGVSSGRPLDRWPTRRAGWLAGRSRPVGSESGPSRGQDKSSLLRSPSPRRIDARRRANISSARVMDRADRSGGGKLLLAAEGCLLSRHRIEFASDESALDTHPSLGSPKREGAGSSGRSGCTSVVRVRDVSGQIRDLVNSSRVVRRPCWMFFVSAGSLQQARACQTSWSGCRTCNNN